MGSTPPLLPCRRAVFDSTVSLNPPAPGGFEPFLILSTASTPSHQLSLPTAIAPSRQPAFPPTASALISRRPSLLPTASALLSSTFPPAHCTSTASAPSRQPFPPAHRHRLLSPNPLVLLSTYSLKNSAWPLHLSPSPPRLVIFCPPHHLLPTRAPTRAYTHTSDRSPIISGGAHTAPPSQLNAEKCG